MTQSQFSNATNRRWKKGSSGGRDNGGNGRPCGVGWGDKLDRAETIVCTRSQLYSSRQAEPRRHSGRHALVQLGVAK